MGGSNKRGGEKMNFIQFLAAADTNLDTGDADEGVKELVSKSYESFLNVVNVVMPVIISVVLVFGVIYGIILGINFAKAEDTEQRDKAKQRIINMVIGVLVAVVIAGIIYAILGNATFIKNLFPKITVDPNGDTTTTTSFLSYLGR